MKPTQEKTNSFLLCMHPQPHSHYSFSKISRILFDFLNNTYWVSLFQRNNLLILQTGVSCFSLTLFYSTLFCCGGKANLVRFTLFYSTLLTLTDRTTDRGTNTLISCGLEELFYSCAVVSVFCSGGKQVLVLHTTYVLGVSYHTDRTVTIVSQKY